MRSVVWEGERGVICCGVSMGLRRGGGGTGLLSGEMRGMIHEIWMPWMSQMWIYYV